MGQQIDWLLTRVAGSGFAIVPARINEPDVLIRERDVRRFDRSGQRVTLAIATFEGKLRVIDVDRLRHALTHGIGHAKAYGCGLLTLARLRA
ncbi:hypothetical protein G443_001167 [Actinoalloteichus cyanogriseus DSM 43889]|uniref:Type I-E CRISPR-associated protein Cas6/Cse3/CasE n=1 Tax=Actinoalloteichus caeruleus DSM 43889 TaxID=1120930 RepID=A0ABT1JEH1_ACTCY|nr:hypothetical protein [Actinoalloteichus caeruleus DSM 43889]